MALRVGHSAQANLFLQTRTNSLAGSGVDWAFFFDLMAVGSRARSQPAPEPDRWSERCSPRCSRSSCRQAECPSTHNTKEFQYSNSRNKTNSETYVILEETTSVWVFYIKKWSRNIEWLRLELTSATSGRPRDWKESWELQSKRLGPSKAVPLEGPDGVRLVRLPLSGVTMLAGSKRWKKKK